MDHADHTLAMLEDTKDSLKKDFSKPKSHSQSIVGFKKITMSTGEMPWQLDQRLKCVIRELICSSKMVNTASGL